MAGGFRQFLLRGNVVDLAVGTKGRIYVAAANPERIMTLSSGGRVLANWTLRTAHRPYTAYGFTTDARGNLYLIDQTFNGIVELDPSGRMLGHWIMPVLSYSDGHLATGNALATPGWWVVTWLSQVMPLVFFAGGAANLISFRRAESTRKWLAGRIKRLMVPVLPLMAVWLVMPDFLRGLGVPPQPLQVGSAIAAQLLWFLAVYVLVVLLTPVMVAAHRRWGLKVPLVMGVAGILVDVARPAGL